MEESLDTSILVCIARNLPFYNSNGCDDNTNHECVLATT